MDEQKPNQTPPEAPNNGDARQIPGYQILEKLGAGAMAVVFKAKQISLDRIVAIKVLPKKLSADKEYVQRFYAEGQVAAKLNHPNIVQAIDVSESHGYHYFVMEYVEGKTVYDELQEGKVYEESEALGIAIQMARALEHAHSQGLIHRDVKPKNIMITTDGTAKLMDMGLARVADDAQAIAAETGRLFGTPYYISPEQIIGKHDVDSRCDIYSLGATLYHMITGKVPFEGKDAKEVMIKHCKEKLVSPDRHNLDISFGLVKVIMKMMAKKRKNRYATTAEVLEDLQSIDFLLEADTAPRNKPPDQPKPQPAAAPQPAAQPQPAPIPQTASLNKTFVVCLIVSVLLNVLLVIMLFLRG